MCFSPVFKVRALAAGFGPTLQAHLSLAFQDLQVYDRWRCLGSEEPPECLRSTEHQQESTRELFQVLLRSLEQAQPCRFLLQEALLQRSPTLAVMAACQQVTMTTVKAASAGGGNHAFKWTGGGASGVPLCVGSDLHR